MKLSHFFCSATVTLPYTRSMPGKQLLAAASVLAVLAGGSCGYQDPNPRPTTPRLASPPSLVPDLRASRAIRVEVANLSPTQHIASQPLINMLIVQINQELEGVPLKARIGAAPEPGDAVLHIEILEESLASPQGRGHATYHGQVTFNGTLTASDGTVIWRAANRTYISPRHPTFSASDGDPWRDSTYWLDTPFTGWLIKQIFIAY